MAEFIIFDGIHRAAMTHEHYRHTSILHDYPFCWIKCPVLFCLEGLLGYLAAT